jgi:predicted O-linked N-acetylglucosamine transferase (SPINDLY family)
MPEARRRFEAALAVAQAFAPAHQGLGGIDLSEGRIGEAIQHLQAALRIEPGNANASAMLAGAFFEAGDLEQSAAQARHALDCNSMQADTYATLANIHFVRSDLEQAIAVLKDGYARTRSSLLLGTLAYHLRHACDWTRWHQVWKELEPLLATSDQLGSPFWLLCQPTTPEQQLHYARRSAAARFRSQSASSAPAPPPPRDRLRIGYLSSDFQQHAVAYLIAEVLEEHDRDRFEIFAYSYGPEDGGTMRPRLRAACEHFVDIARVSEDAAAERIRADALDLLVDLKGYTAGERLAILARRPCATQLTWLGYPGTLGTTFIDYAIVDPVLVPPGAEQHYSERILRLPHCYQPNDRKRAVAPTQSRSAYGLPENGFVFCCFNQTYKITPEVFSVWMRLLQQVPGSVLWLFESQPLAAGNLQGAARAHGVDPSRIVFAPRLPNPEHLARYRAADLALDTFPYTSHTTLSDALWCGCPGVVLCGETFAARVSASIAVAAGIPEIVAYSLADYERLVCELALQPQRLEALRARVQQAREISPLFDSAAFARDLEGLYKKLVEQSRNPH